MTYAVRPVSWVVCPKDEPMFSELVTTVTIVDESAGEFVEVKQHRRDDPDHGSSITIDCDEWPALRKAIDMATANCRPVPATGER